MTLRNRLRQIYGPGQSAPSQNGEEAHLRKRLEKIGRQGPRPAPDAASMARFLEGHWGERPGGRVLRVERRFGPGHQHGRLPLEAFFSLPREPLRLLAADDGFESDPESLLFLDTETTGLAGGAGTYVFLIGVGFFRDGEFRLHQLFLPDYASEKALLGELASIVAGDGRRPFSQLVSFNGKCYDLNLLANRFVLQRLEDPLSELRHLDLIHPCRILWRGRFESCALQTLERNLLGLRRQDDIPSHLIPQTYFDFLRNGRYQRFASVFEHNRLDILSMVSLLSLAAEVVRDPLSNDFADPLSAARLHQLRGSLEEAARILRQALDSETGGQADNLAWLRELARIEKRLGRADHSLRLWRLYLKNHPEPPQEAFEEAAKILEHGNKDYQDALLTVRQALANFPDDDALARRRHRLECKLAGKRWWKI